MKNTSCVIMWIFMQFNKGFHFYRALCTNLTSCY